MAASFPNLFDYSTDSGMVIPTTDGVKTNVQNAMFEIFGSGFDVTEDTPNGRLIEALTLLVKNGAGVTAQNMNAMNLNYVSGKQLDNYASFFGVERLPATKSKLMVLGYTKGSNPKEIPEGTICYDSFGNKYKVSSWFNNVTNETISGIPTSTTSNIIDVFGDGSLYCEGSGLVEAVEAGPFFPQSNGEYDGQGYELTTDNPDIKIRGLFLATSEQGAGAGPSIIGRYEESDYELRLRIKDVRDFGGSSTQAIANAIWKACPVLRTVKVISNDTSSTISYSDEMKTKILPNSIIVAVSGSLKDNVPYLEDEERKSIAEAIFKTKAAGVAYTDPRVDKDVNGSVWGSSVGDIYVNGYGATVKTIRKNIIPITDISSGIEHNVIFYETGGIQFNIFCTVRLNGYTGGDVKKAISETINQYVGGKINTLTPTELTMIITASLPGVFVTSLKFFQSSGKLDENNNIENSNVELKEITPSILRTLVPLLINITIEE